MTATCLNCNKELNGDYCSHCGQSAKTHRFTLKYVFKQDFLFSILHVNRGLLYSIKELFTRPGHSIREYIKGKRVTHLNYFTLLVIILLVFSLVEELTPFHYADLVETQKEIVEGFESLIKKHPKYLYLGIIPFHALFSFLFFKRAMQNYAEHFVLNTYKISAILILNILFILLASFVKDISIIKKADAVLYWVTLAYGTWFYYQYFIVFYQNKFMLFIKSALCAFLPALILVLGIVAYFTLTSSSQI
ncbi:MAG: DUF3667 domain-containing protein [Cyclobacteriaceae bacterium]|nr:DUF3667 domain-containing protein [Cyclobacteriaceae bacterium]